MQKGAKVTIFTLYMTKFFLKYIVVYENQSQFNSYYVLGQKNSNAKRKRHNLAYDEIKR